MARRPYACPRNWWLDDSRTLHLSFSRLQMSTTSSLGSTTRPSIGLVIRALLPVARSHTVRQQLPTLPSPVHPTLAESLVAPQGVLEDDETRQTSHPLPLPSGSNRRPIGPCSRCMCPQLSCNSPEALDLRSRRRVFILQQPPNRNFAGFLVRWSPP
jgi:hypothetical protein